MVSTVYRLGSVAAWQPGNSGLARKKRAYEFETAAYSILGVWYVVVEASRTR